MPLLLLNDLCLTPLASTNTCGFVFTLLTFCQVYLLINYATLAFAKHIWVLLSALSWMRELGPLPLEVVALTMNYLNS